ncbi:D-alanyl-D-alanine carboxypeptidase family protein [Fuchsiella alkaliacetigena]|uniref:D-alanyl-D-alanine carboxypeptidase family protein n=1 Tax=Fuchsiella alkaliacetigena TaxID=957042 RepID=UPI002009DE84|nr:D-alanyl-D-alanine carboxypeptidase family protein [Fuchsiella alkaliacetigena]MCK8825727.1 D-alanyl-D-alanine carboxypeptidase [Fuchsiella alkaliacetigena]
MKEKKWSKLFIIAILLLLLTINISTLEAKPEITAESAILIDAETGEVLYSQNAHEKRPPASTTKIMTGILALEMGDLDAEVKASSRAAYEGGSTIWLGEGEVLKLEELLYGLLLNSGNDAAVAIAEHIGGSVEEFAHLMNRKARELGALNTTFKNPNGLPQPGHLTTAYDLAMITRYALQNQTFAEIVNTTRKTITWQGHTYGRSLLNTNRLLRRFKNVDGVKTGYTNAAGRCLVSSATKEGRQVISVVLKSNQMWNDSIKLLNYGLEAFERIQIVEEGEEVHSLSLAAAPSKELSLMAAQDLAVVLPVDEESQLSSKVKLKSNLNLPIEQGESVGRVVVYADGQVKGSIPLLAKEELTPDSKWDRFWNWLSAAGQLFL